MIDTLVPTGVPPQFPVYHLQLAPDPPVAVSVLLAPAQMAVGFPPADAGATGTELTVSVAASDVTDPHELLTTQS